MILKTLVIVAAVFLSGCTNFNYGELFKEPEPSEDKATLVFYREGVVANQVPLDIAIDGVTVVTMNPKGYKTVRVAPGEYTFNSSTKMVDLRNKYKVDSGRTYYMRMYCYSIPLAYSLCKVEAVNRLQAEHRLRVVRESLDPPVHPSN